MQEDLRSMDRQMANAIRFLAMDAVQEANSGHAGMPLGAADFAMVLFSRHLKFDPANPRWPDRDRFVLSAGHGSMLLYALLYLTGYAEMTIDQIRRFRKLGARTAGHPEFGHAPGIEATTGPLGQGLAMGVGMALAERMLNARFGDNVVDHRTFVLAGDGCLMEGVSQEAISFAGHLRLSKLTVLFDDNGISIDGPTDLSVSDDHLRRFAASGWHTLVVDGHDAPAISSALDDAKRSDLPSFIACKTRIGYGAPTKAGKASAHSSPLGTNEVASARATLNWPYGAFDIPAEILDAWRVVGAKGHARLQEWRKRLEAEPDDHRRAFLAQLDSALPPGWRSALSDLKIRLAKERPAWATRKASGEVLKLLTSILPQLVGGSADLSEAVFSQVGNLASINRGGFDGRHIHYGVREHAMAAIMNGISLHEGFIPYGGTFLVFTDYMRGAMRLSALMGRQVIYILTHDSIGLGEDGPTHQAVETLSGLRALPNFKTFRPCDPVETAECWEAALTDDTGPSGIVLSRQTVPTVRKSADRENLSMKGGYVLATGSGDPAVTILATGSEVAIALAARDILEAAGVGTSVVSMPCWELFDRQDNDYRCSVLSSAAVMIAVEAGVRHGWDRYIGRDGIFIGMTGFGASAPAEDLFKQFGITAARIANAAMERLAVGESKWAPRGSRSSAPIPTDARAT
jgi:transketolase